MAFQFVKSLSGENAPTLEKRTATANTAISADCALTVTAGAVLPTAGKPAFIAACAAASAAAPVEVAVYPVLPQHIYESTFSAAATAVKVGDKVTLTADGLQVTATTASGVATIWRMFGTAAGSKVHVRFE